VLPLGYEDTWDGGGGREKGVVMDGRMATASCVAPFVSLMNRSYLRGGGRQQGALVGWCDVGIRSNSNVSRLL